MIMKKGGTGMFDRIDDVIKKLGKILFYISIIASIVWILIAMGNNENIIIPICSGIASVIASLLIYGFGEVIYCLRNIQQKNSNGYDDSNEVRNRVKNMHNSMKQS